MKPLYGDSAAGLEVQIRHLHFRHHEGILCTFDPFDL
jgi:hypothetical protein